MTYTVSFAKFVAMIKFEVSQKSFLKMLAKLFFAALIIYWLISQDRLNYKSVLQSLSHPFNWIICLLLLICMNVLAAIRWRILLSKNNQLLPLKSLIRIQWIGQFFSVFLPGGITSDVVKIKYVLELTKNLSKRELFISIFIDRLAGLIGLLLIAGISSLVFYSDLLSLNPHFENVIAVNMIFLAISIVIVSVLFVPQKVQAYIIKKLPIKKINDLLCMIWCFSEKKLEMTKAILISSLTHFISISVFWIINTPFFEKAIPLKYLMSLVPIGLISIVIPISPSGLGVGHIAFDKLFHFINQNNGASLFNLYWITVFVVNLLGIIPFLITRKKFDIKY